jgi:hypothetical protein
MSSNLHRNSTEANKHTPKGFDLAVNNSRLIRDERGQSRYIDNLLNERAENLVDGNSAPPTTTEGHVYVLIDEGSGSVHVDWQGADYNDIVRVQGGVWSAITPVSGYLILNKTDGKYYKFNGSIWEEFGVGATIELYDDVSVTPLTPRLKQRAVDYIEFADDAINEETKIQLRADRIKDAEVTRFAENGAGNVDLKIQENKLPTGDSNGFAIEYTASAECIIGLDSDNEIKEFEVIEIYNILKEEGITANKTLALLDINGDSANVKAKFEISAIAVQNTTANAVTINIGSTALGTDVVNAFALGASETKKLPLGTTFFSITSGQNLFISSGSWNSASINIHVTISKIWQ